MAFASLSCNAVTVEPIHPCLSGVGVFGVPVRQFSGFMVFQAPKAAPVNSGPGSKRVFRSPSDLKNLVEHADHASSGE